MYKEYKPNIALLPYIETYWTTNGYLDHNVNDRILPDGCVDILFSFEPSSHNELVAGIPYIIGTMTSFSDIEHNKGQVEMIGIRFRPVGITAFLSVPINELTDQKIEVSLIDSVFDNNFYLQLSEFENINLKLQYIDAYFYSKLSYLNILDKRIVYAIQLIRKTQGIMKLTDVAHKSCMSPRNFERVFKSLVGISPKKFQNIIRFNHTRRYIKQNPREDLVTIAINCGYYDHTHLIREFKSLSGTSPVFYRG